MKKMKDPYLNGELLYKKYFSMGQAASITTLARWAVAQGMTQQSRYTNKLKLPKMGVWKAMWRWASMKENQGEAFQIFKDYVYNYGWSWDNEYPWQEGNTVSTEHWNQFMRKTIRSAWQYSETKNQRFLKENGWI